MIPPSLKMSVKSLVEKMYLPLNNGEDVSEFNSLSLLFGVSVDTPCYADLINLRAAKFSQNDCAVCNKCSKVSCYRSDVYVADNRIKIHRIPCNKQRANAAVNVSSIPKKFAGIRAKNWQLKPDNKLATVAATESINNNAGLYLYGNVGTGKTMLCSIIAIERAFLGKSSFFYTVTDMLEDLRDFDNPVKRSEKLNRIKKCPCLIIDDLGAEYATEWVSSTLFSVLDARYKDNLQTIINSNFPLDSLKSRIKGYHGERIIRRISELCAVVPIA